MAYSVQGRPKKARQGKSKVKSMLNILFNNKRIVHKELLLAGQTVSSHIKKEVHTGRLISQQLKR
jgi:hypothetical protein